MIIGVTRLCGARSTTWGLLWWVVSADTPGFYHGQRNGNIDADAFWMAACTMVKFLSPQTVSLLQSGTTIAQGVAWALIWKNSTPTKVRAWATLPLTKPLDNLTLRVPVCGQIQNTIWFTFFIQQNLPQWWKKPVAQIQVLGKIQDQIYRSLSQ